MTDRRLKHRRNTDNVLKEILEIKKCLIGTVEESKTGLISKIEKAFLHIKLQWVVLVMILTAITTYSFRS